MTPLETVLTWAAAVTTIGVALGIIWKVFTPVVKKTRKLLDSLGAFTEDWFGTEASPGRDKVPGVMERLNNIDGELKHNGGSTMKDAVKRIETGLNDINLRLDEGNKRFDDIERRLDGFENKDQK